jgi:hypothetical protein
MNTEGKLNKGIAGRRFQIVVENSDLKLIHQASAILRISSADFLRMIAIKEANNIINSDRGEHAITTNS